MQPERCLRDPSLPCPRTCLLFPRAAETTRRCPIDPDIDPEEYKAWGHVIMQRHGSTNAGREIREHCAQP
ncbi:MAG TPA: hypothetical protein VEW42_04060 [Candidatus Eisenbacteria bacterium]|nr:hypothetical protein [Candidatus Eisenbacteria bacterium]